MGEGREGDYSLKVAISVLEKRVTPVNQLDMGIATQLAEGRCELNAPK
jgi:hypothetical protein